MARKKITLRYIANKAIRRATLKKRRRSILKKVGELATLCDVKACAVIYGPGETTPDVWPNDNEARRILQRLKNMPEIAQFKKMMSQEEFLRERVNKLNDQLNRHVKENKHLETSILMLEVLAGRNLHDLGPAEVYALAHLIDTKRNEVRRQLEMHADAQTEAPRGPPVWGAQMHIPSQQMNVRTGNAYRLQPYVGGGDQQMNVETSNAYALQPYVGGGDHQMDVETSNAYALQPYVGGGNQQMNVGTSNGYVLQPYVGGGNQQMNVGTSNGYVLQPYVGGGNQQMNAGINNVYALQPYVGGGNQWVPPSGFFNL